MERNQRSQAKFIRSVKMTINLICGAGIIALLIYAFCLAKSPAPTEKANPVGRVAPPLPTVK